MDDMSIVLYICFLIPMFFSLFIMESKSRLVVGYILIGTTVCLIITYVNTYICNALDKDMLYFCTTISPITEELIKALPILFYALFISDNWQKLTQSSFAIGLGFAIMENMIMLTQSASGTDIRWAVFRGLGAGLMHSICTVAIGIGISFVRKIRKMFYCCTFSLLMLAATYHSIYNSLVMSKYKYFGIVLPVLTYIPLLIVQFKRKKKNADN